MCIRDRFNIAEAVGAVDREVFPLLHRGDGAEMGHLGVLAADVQVPLHHRGLVQLMGAVEPLEEPLGEEEGAPPVDPDLVLAALGEGGEVGTDLPGQVVDDLGPVAEGGEEPAVDVAGDVDVVAAGLDVYKRQPTGRTSATKRSPALTFPAR